MATNVTLNEAATYLGVSKATLRNWDNDGKLSAITKSVNGNRIICRMETKALKKLWGDSL